MNTISGGDEFLMREVIAGTLGIPVADVTAAHAGHLALHHLEPGAQCPWPRRSDDRARPASSPPPAAVAMPAFGVEVPRPEFEQRFTTQADLDRGETRIPRLQSTERLIWGGEDVQPIGRRQAMRILGFAWASAGALFALMALGELLRAVASR